MKSLRIRPLHLLLLLAAIGAALPFGMQAGAALVVSRPLDNPDAIVSLASHEWERLPLAAALARRYPRALVLLTLPSAVNQYNCHDCGHRVERLSGLGVVKDRVRILPLTASGTYGEALAVREFARHVPIGRLMVVTSPYHTRRSLAVFSNVMAPLRMMVGITPASNTSQARAEQWWRTPYDRWYVGYEWAAIPYYAVRYGVNAFSVEP